MTTKTTTPYADHLIHCEGGILSIKDTLLDWMEVRFIRCFEDFGENCEEEVSSQDFVEYLEKNCDVFPQVSLTKEGGRYVIRY